MDDDHQVNEYLHNIENSQLKTKEDIGICKKNINVNCSMRITYRTNKISIDERDVGDGEFGSCVEKEIFATEEAVAQHAHPAAADINISNTVDTCKRSAV